MREENLKIIYNEVVELHKYQQQGLDLMYNKLNWILVSDLVILALLYNSRRPSALVILLVSLSAVFALISFEPKNLNILQRYPNNLTVLIRLII